MRSGGLLMSVGERTMYSMSIDSSQMSGTNPTKNVSSMDRHSMLQSAVRSAKEFYHNTIPGRCLKSFMNFLSWLYNFGKQIILQVNFAIEKAGKALGFGIIVSSGAVEVAVHAGARNTTAITAISLAVGGFAALLTKAYDAFQTKHSRPSIELKPKSQ